MAVLGASASAGFGCVLHEHKSDGEYTAGYCLIDMIRYACPDLALVTSDESSAFFFLDPIDTGKDSVQQALTFKPDCVVALDFLFWYCYGEDAVDGTRLKDEGERLAKFEAGLAQLEQFTVPVIVGTIPNMERAIGLMLSKEQVPQAATLAKVNERLIAWAKERPRVVVFPLAQMQQQLLNNGSLDIAGEHLVSSPDAPLLQKDQLHPSPRGLAGIGCAAATALKTALGDMATSGATCESTAAETFERARAELKIVVRPTARPASPPAVAPGTTPTDASPVVALPEEHPLARIRRATEKLKAEEAAKKAAAKEGETKPTAPSETTKPTPAPTPPSASPIPPTPPPTAPPTPPAG